MKIKSPLDTLLKANKGVRLVFAAIILFTILGILLILTKSVLTQPHVITPQEGDYLIYVISNPSEKSQLILYDLTSEKHMPILSDEVISSISVSANGRLAFSSAHEDSSPIYILDYPFSNGEPINIIGDNSAQNFTSAWSQDGRYLAYVSIQDNGETLSIWDGNNSFKIFDSLNSISEITWGPNGRLAFTEFDFTPTDEKDSSEVFIWDGDKTVSLSQNPNGSDRFPEWNENGQLAFNSSRKGESDIFVWDGLSTINGMPDVNTFSNIAPHLTWYFSDPVWSNSGTLTFQGSGPRDEHVQIYEWDGIRANNISQNPDFHNGGQRWRGDGYWSFITYFSNEQLIYIRDAKNQRVLIAEGQYSPAWSQSGYLIFCNQTGSGTERTWSLSMWNGAKVIEIARGHNIVAFWSNGSSVFCSFG